MTNFKATTEQWENAEYYADPDRKPRPLGEYACLLELRARIEALEAAHRPDKFDRLIALDRDDNGSLVERVAVAIDAAPYDEDRHQWDEARAAIREVATALREVREHRGWLATFAWLQQEASK